MPLFLDACAFLIFLLTTPFCIYSYFLTENCNSVILHWQLNVSKVWGVSVINSATIEKLVIDLY